MADQIPFSFDVATVTDITNQIKQILESNFRDVLVEGEISNVSQSRNGHYYFTVKDDHAQLPCVVWRSTAQRMDVELSDGQQVILGGDIQVYAPHGRYQMIVRLVQQAGMGRLQQKFEELKNKLQKEGLFDDAHKKPLPPFPSNIGVITSSTGAAFHDIRSTFEQRWPLATLYLHHASVQGLNAAGELADAIQTLSEHPDIELLIIGRGGGSLEDLWPFNEEKVARAIYNCPIPIISAVGHEVDFSISDFVADARAATPTQAAMIAAPDINDLRMQIDDYAHGIEVHLKQKIDRYKEYVHRLGHSHALLKVQDRIVHMKRTVDTHQRTLHHLQQKIRLNKRAKLQEILHRLDRKNPNEPMERGFSRVWQGETWIRSREQFDDGSPLKVEWQDGEKTITP
ncbi:exodeoxyribonuclease VII large subunit [Rhodohalobacter sp. SW132]|uniref:exodeoxyribonuclease VII large subunit n=1 Tax=Rhodohalobacter sp. SW132 TaxID=2293433 RepID=UPI000E251831|nr:exodeoxyribonuclease VII large subunit [Rhodohalobacter sp. SW132]REL33158.1 exodeoxyribonuclease VII large subunit [Rhodohalobacter sp. SW132]